MLRNVPSDIPRLIAERSVPEPNSGCWLWLAGTNWQGYGKLKVSGRTLFAHRVSYSAFVAEIPSGLQVCHRCDVTACVNPDHLFLGTSADNHADRNGKGRQAAGDRQGLRVHPERAARGERNASAKLNSSQIPEIRRRLNSGEKPSAIAAEFGVSVAAIRFIHWGRTWKHV